MTPSLAVLPAPWTAMTPLIIAPLNENVPLHLIFKQLMHYFLIAIG